MPIGDITENFETQTDTIGNVQLDAYNPVVQAGQRAWMLPELNNWSGSPFELSGAFGINSAFDRTDINDEYLEAVNSDEGKVVDRMSTKIQIDYLACMERAFRARHATSVRCALHASARHFGHGSSGNIFKVIPTYLKEMLALGYNDA